MKSKGFTIVELLIVIVIFAILATLVTVTFTGIKDKQKNSKLPDCDTYGSYALKDVPARCVQYFEGSGK